MSDFDTKLLPIYRNTVLSSGREGVLRLVNEEVLSALQSVRQNEHRYAVLVDERTPDQLSVGDSVTLQLQDPSIAIGLVADSLNDVLAFPRGRTSTPKYFLLDKALAYTDPAPAGELALLAYRRVVELVALLAEAATYFEKDREELIFLKDGKVEIRVLYSVDDLIGVDSTALDALLEKMAAHDKLREQMLGILAECVIKQVSSLEPKRRFPALLAHLPEVVKSFDDGHRLYVANFSYAKVKDELQAAMLDELAKINKVFADVQGQILGIPIATVLVATQLKQATGWDQVAWVNSAVLFGVFFFVVLSNFVMRNQLHTLDNIEQEIVRKEKKITAQYAAVKDMVSETFPKLRSRLRLQRLAFWAVQLLLALGFCAALTLYFVMTPTAWITVRTFLGLSQ